MAFFSQENSHVFFKLKTLLIERGLFLSNDGRNALIHGI